MRQGKFIVLEGLDGCGKSTQLKRLADSLTQKGEAVILTAEPTDFETGAYLRRILSESQSKNMYLQAALFLADRLEHITHPEFGIRQYLEKGYTVICDRYYYSSFAYQGTASDIDWVMDTNLNCREMLTPDLCIFLDVNPDTCKERIDKVREKPELYEKDVALMREIRNNFLRILDKLKAKQNIAVIDANRSLDDVEKEIFDHVQKTFYL
ncbi:MAG: dTMP kinase [Clostridia bacterium]|nr:dTMP kinase [Clostridia bacterium]